MVALADMCLDLAMLEPARASVHIGRAKDSLDETTERLYELGDYGAMREADRWRPYALQAALRRSELDNWGNAAAGRPLQHDYDALLDAAIAIDPAKLDTKSWSTLIEFMPVLLGARARERGSTRGWLARLALIREEARISLVPGANCNWDTALLPGNDPDSFSAPPVRVNLKLGETSNVGDYARGGVIVLSARKHGIACPPQIIYSCLQEADGSCSSAAGMPYSLLSSGELDETTDRIFGSTISVANAA